MNTLESFLNDKAGVGTSNLSYEREWRLVTGDMENIRERDKKKEQSPN
jgi:hypothetical protein